MSGKAINIVVVGALAAAVIVLGIILLGGGETHRLRAGFDNAIQLTKGQEVRVAGREVGRIGEIDLVDGQASVELEITDGDAWPLPKGTTARARYGSTTSYLSRYVELYPGPKDAGELEEDAIIRTQSAEELDEAYRIFRDDTDAETSKALTDLGDSLEDQGISLEKGLKAAPRGLDAVGDLTRELAADEERLRTLAVAGDRTTTALAAQAPELQELIVNAAGTIEEFAQHTAAQQQALDRAPETFEETTGTLARLDTSLDKLDGLVADIRPGAPALRELAQTARGTLEELRTVSPQIVSTLDRGTAAAPRLTRLFDTATPFFPRADRALKTFNPMFACLRPYGPEIAGFLTTWSGQLSHYDAIGYYARSFPLTVVPALLPGTGADSKTALDLQQGELTYAMPRPPGLNAGQPWFMPKCGITEDALDVTKDPELNR